MHYTLFTAIIAKRLCSLTWTGWTRFQHYETWTQKRKQEKPVNYFPRRHCQLSTRSKYFFATN